LNKIQQIHDKLLARYGQLNWWPADNEYEVMVGAILTQNTNWGNVEKSIDNFAGRLAPEFIENIPLDELINIISPSGFYNQKAIYLKEMTHWYKGYNYSVETVKKHPLERIRKELLAVKGIGFETADSILLYAFSYPTFVVDAYTKRLLERLGITSGKMNYQYIKAHFEANIPADAGVYNNYHAMIVMNAKEHCRSNPKCDGCPLEDMCLCK